MLCRGCGSGCGLPAVEKQGMLCRGCGSGCGLLAVVKNVGVWPVGVV